MGVANEDVLSPHRQVKMTTPNKFFENGGDEAGEDIVKLLSTFV